MMLIYILLITMTILGSVASLFLKRAAGKHFDIAIKDKNLYIGGILYFTSAIINIYVLRHMDYSVVLPLTSLTYIWTLVLSNRFLGECVSIRKVIGVFFIILGAVLISLQ